MEAFLPPPGEALLTAEKVGQRPDSHQAAQTVGLSCIDGVMTHPTEKHPQAVALTYERRPWKVLDPDLAPDFERLARSVAARLPRVARLHGDREQGQRDAAMTGFRDGKYRILIATDIAARGIDVADIEHVINYDFPRSAEDYIHRIGRTARVAANGLATSFATQTDRPCLSKLERLISATLPVTPAGASRAKRPHRPTDSSDGNPGRAGRRIRRRSGRRKPGA